MEQWNAMSPEEQARVVAMLPADPIPLQAMGESDTHYDAVDETRKGLRRLFGERRRSVYVGTNLSVYYPEEPVFTPDTFAVLDVSTHPRSTWVVAKEKRGLDLVIEVCVVGDRRKERRPQRGQVRAAWDYRVLRPRAGTAVAPRSSARRRQPNLRGPHTASGPLHE